jgi:hypothetical protein
MRARAPQKLLGLKYHLRIPQCRILLGKRNVVAVGITPRVTPGFGVQHECEQAERFRFLRQKFGRDSGQKERFLGEIAVDDICADRISPAFRERSIDSIENSIEPASELLALWNAEWNTGVSHFVFSANEPLAHRRGRHEKRRRDGLCVQAKDYLQNQRRANSSVYCRVRTSKHQRKPLIWNFGSAYGSVEPFGHNAQLVGSKFMAAQSPVHINGLSARDCEQPRFWIRWTAIPGPVCKRGSKGFGERVFGSRDIARARREKGNELAVTTARDGIRRAARLRIGFRGTHTLTKDCEHVRGRCRRRPPLQ